MKACRLRTLDKLLASFGGGFTTLFSHDFDYSFGAIFQYIFAVPFWYLAKSIYRLHSVTLCVQNVAEIKRFEEALKMRQKTYEKSDV